MNRKIFFCFYLSLSSLFYAEAQTIKSKIKFETSENKDFIGYLIVSLVSDQSCYINLETGYIGLTNKPDEFYLDLRDSQYISIPLDPGGTYGHWYMPSLLGGNNDSLRKVVEEQFQESKQKYGAISNMKKIYLKKNKYTKLKYKILFSETRYLDGSLSTQDFTYTLNRNQTYYLRLSYYSYEKGEINSNSSFIDKPKVKFHTNFVKFTY